MIGPEVGNDNNKLLMWDFLIIKLLMWDYPVTLPFESKEWSWDWFSKIINEYFKDKSKKIIGGI